jgi:hypothetical protein
MEATDLLPVGALEPGAGAALALPLSSPSK